MDSLATKMIKHYRNIYYWYAWHQGGSLFKTGYVRLQFVEVYLEHRQAEHGSISSG